MATFNSSVSDRKFTQISINESESQVDVDGQYSFTINNNGILPTGSLTVKLSSLKIGNNGVEVASDKKQNIGRIKPLGSKEVTFEFEYSTSKSGIPQVIESVCNQGLIVTSTEGRIIGSASALDTSSQGTYVIDKSDCNLYSEPEPEPEPDPEPEPEPDPPDENEDGNEDNEDRNNENQQDDSEIQGSNIVRLGETNRYEWADFPQETERLDWVLLAEENVSEGDASLMLADNQAETLLLDLVINVTGDYLIVTSAIADGEVIEQQEKVVSAVN